ncbi:hypothetical protein ZIOFF_035460 [Zingiber officinale]|uniref:Uncharacterized protein n=1 Tax=Zingiber officinale TaxID=94328 RepID=A0A8J5GGG6_ZINOF|nr:hypothetical protein ZIOFF_035460 [Zingiber officinale]
MDVEDKLALPGSDHAEKKKVASLRAFIKAEYLDAQVTPYHFYVVNWRIKHNPSIGPWKRKCLANHGIVSQCITPTRVNDQ